jgi:hypothetical protein
VLLYARKHFSFSKHTATTTKNAATHLSLSLSSFVFFFLFLGGHLAVWFPFSEAAVLLLRLLLSARDKHNTQNTQHHTQTPRRERDSTVVKQVVRLCGDHYNLSKVYTEEKNARGTTHTYIRNSRRNK